MTALRFLALPTDRVRDLQNGGLDANGRAPERQVSVGRGNLCRHCLSDVAEGDELLVLAYRPFPAPQPYAEVGPLFLHAGPCARHEASAQLPAVFGSRDRLLLRAYGPDDRILYGSGRLVTPEDVPDAAGALLAWPAAAYLHLRSATNGCYQCRIERGI